MTRINISGGCFDVGMSTMQSTDSRPSSPSPERDTLLQPLNASGAEATDEMPTAEKSGDERGMIDNIGLGLVYGGSYALVLLTFILVLVGSSAKYGWFTFHPVLQSLSIASLILGITPLQPPSSNSRERSTNFDTHQKILLRMTSPLMLLGSGAVWWNKYIRSADHFTTWHGTFGAVSVAWMIIQGGMGVGMAWYGSQIFGSERDAKRMYKYHRLSGYMLVVLVLGTAFLGGAQSMWARRIEGTYRIAVVLAYWIGLPAIGMGVLIRIRTSKMQFT